MINLIIQIIHSVEVEIKLLSNLNHKNIVKYFGVKRNEDEFNILLEYCIGIVLNIKFK